MKRQEHIARSTTAIDSLIADLDSATRQECQAVSEHLTSIIDKPKNHHQERMARAIRAMVKTLLKSY